MEQAGIARVAENQGSVLPVQTSRPATFARPDAWYATGLLLVGVVGCVLAFVGQISTPVFVGLYTALMLVAVILGLGWQFRVLRSVRAARK